MSKIQERVALFIESTRIPKSEVDKRLGISNGFTGKIVSGKSSFSVSILEKIILEFPNLNAHWLVTGEGNMLKNGEDKPNISELTDIEALIERKVKEALAKEKAGEE